MNKNPYILVEVCFESEEDLDREDYYKEIGVNIKNKREGKNFEIIPRIILTDHIVAFGPSTFKGITTVHTGPGEAAFLVRGEMDEILAKIYPDADLSPFGPTEDDFEI